jgi:hypothetical protein
MSISSPIKRYQAATAAASFTATTLVSSSITAAIASSTARAAFLDLPARGQLARAAHDALLQVVLVRHELPVQRQHGVSCSIRLRRNVPASTRAWSSTGSPSVRLQCSR